MIAVLCSPASRCPAPPLPEKVDEAARRRLPVGVVGWPLVEEPSLSSRGARLLLGLRGPAAPLGLPVRAADDGERANTGEEASTDRPEVFIVALSRLPLAPTVLLRLPFVLGADEGATAFPRSTPDSVPLRARGTTAADDGVRLDMWCDCPKVSDGLRIE